MESMDKNITQTVAPARSVEHTGPAIEMTKLCKDFGAFRAVDHLSLTVQQGEIFGLLGPNGSGKTTTINMISGLSVPTSGEVCVMGYDVRRQARQVRQILGSVPQETALYEELSAWTNMDFHADLFGIRRKEKKERITKLLELVQLQDRKDSRVGTFSGGSVIEVETTQPSKAIDELRALPSVQEVVQDGTHLKITTQGIHNIAPQVINVLSQEGEIKDIAIREPNLDEIFLRLTGTALRD